ncbi:MAG: FAD-dependent oxidoreductase [Lysobacterales bacterium]
MTQVRHSTKTSIVLGAGIMGCSLALFLARGGHRVILVDESMKPMNGASRWNEGKIHLGFLYGADPSLNTARKLLPGGLNFCSLVEELIEQPVRDEWVTQHNDRYLVHRDSVVPTEPYLATAHGIQQLVQQHPDASRYFVDLRPSVVRELSRETLEAEYDSSIIKSGIEVPERSVATQPIADALAGAVAAHPKVELHLSRRVVGVQSRDSSCGPWEVQCEDRAEGQTRVIGAGDFVFNATWHGRIAIDATLNRPRPQSWTHRYRLSGFIRLKEATTLRSAVIAVGPFGDVKNYNGRDLYVSWYNHGLVAETNDLDPRSQNLPKLTDSEILNAKFKTLAKIIPDLASIRSNISSSELRGGWVYAAGKGPLEDASSELHRRDRIGIERHGTYFSIDTGKYSIAPWLARQVVAGVFSEW